MKNNASGYNIHAESENQPIEIKDRPISNFWIRIFAFIIDEIIISIFGYLLGFIFKNYFAQIGQWGIIIGIVVEIMYFGLLNSTVGGGQTIGKKLMRIRVVDKNGSRISVPISFFRAAILITPSYLNGIILPIHLTETLFGIAIYTIIALALFGGGLSIIYLNIFNKKTRQSLHDLICGTYVVKANTEGAIEFGPIWRLHYFVVFIFSIIVIIFVMSNSKIGRSESGFLDVVYERLSKMDNVSSVRIGVGETRNPRSSSKYVKAYIKCKIRPNDFNAIVNQAAEIILANNPPISFYDDIVFVIVEYGYNIGIASTHERHIERLTPLEWEKRIELEKKSDLDVK